MYLSSKFPGDADPLLGALHFEDLWASEMRCLSCVTKDVLRSLPAPRALTDQISVCWECLDIYAKYLPHFRLHCGSAGKESACNAGDLGLIPGLGRSLGEGSDYPLQYSGLKNSIDYIVHGIAKSWT